MPFINTRDVLGERATLDGLIDGTLEEFKDVASFVPATDGTSTTGVYGSLYGLKVKKFIVPNSRPDVGYVFKGNSYIKMIVTYPQTGSNNWGSLFYQCSALETVDLIGYGRINSVYVFNSASSIKTLILRSTTLIPLGAISAFNSSSFDSGGSGGEIYVPKSLISSYPTATNWSTLNAYGTITWKTIEGSEYHHHYADGSPRPHTVAYSLSYCSSSNTDTGTWYGDSYETTITVNSGHINPIITVTMQESVYDDSTDTYSTVTNDITSTVYNSETGVISIPSVTGNISISATAT